MPFWIKYGLDRVNGGIYTCVDRDGALMDSTKSVWFQGRFAFTCSYAYNHIEKNPAWLQAAKSTLDFIEKYCFDSDGRMYFEVTADGRPLRKRRYIFSESFAAIAMSEYSIASGDKTYAVKALELFKRMQYFLQTPGLLAPKYTDTVPIGRIQAPGKGSKHKRTGAENFRLVMGVGLGQRIRRYYQFQRLQESSFAGLCAGYEILVAANRSNYRYPVCLSDDERREMPEDASTNQRVDIYTFPGQRIRRVVWLSASGWNGRPAGKRKFV